MFFGFSSAGLLFLKKTEISEKTKIKKITNKRLGLIEFEDWLLLGIPNNSDSKKNINKNFFL